MLARGQGAVGFGPVTQADALADTLAEAVTAARAGNVVVIDVHVRPGYDPATTRTMLRATP
jgi:hypothetical protein